MAFTATHIVPNTGLQTWPTPDPSQPQGPLLSAGLEVQVLERLGDWAKVACSNGWECWLNGSLLVAVGAPAPVPAPAPAPSGPPTAAAAASPTAAPATALPSWVPPGAAKSLNMGVEYGVGPLTLVGGALMVLGSFLDWWTFGNLGGATAWDLPFVGLITGGNDVQGLKAGLVLLVAVAVMLLPLVTRQRAANNFGRIAGAVAAGTVVLALVRFFAEDAPGLSLGFGFFIAAAGAGLVAYEIINALRKN